ncbi:MAG TPA: invasin domain 3-containing protein, partial [Phycisphaerales bacterium]|nr:invasin domain 3-containing protein [Phycisphaerales bacterium]
PSAESPHSDLQAEWATNVNTVDAHWANLNGGGVAVEIRAAVPAEPPPPPPPPPPVSPTLSTVTADPASIAAGGPTATITVAVKDESGAPISGATVVLSATGDGNTLVQPAGPTDASGVATGTLSSSVVGSATVSATANGTAITQTATVEVTEPPPPPPPPPPPTEVVTPDPVTIDAIMARVKPDPRVQFPQSAAPTDEAFAVAVINLASALAKGDSDALNRMLDPGAKETLDGLVNSGDWDTSTERIEAVRVIRTEDSGIVYVAVQEPGSAYLLGWMGRPEGAGFVFGGAPSAPMIKSRASEFDGMSAFELAGAGATLPTTPAPAEEPTEPATPAAPSSGGGGRTPVVGG